MAVLKAEPTQITALAAEISSGSAQISAALARLEGQVAIGTLARRFPEMSLGDGDPPEWNGRIVLRGLERLPVRLNG